MIIFLIILSAIVFIGAVILLAPLRVTMHGTLNSDTHDFTVQGYWLHRAVARVQYLYTRDDLDIRFFGKRFFSKKNDHKIKSEPVDSVQPPPVQPAIRPNASVQSPVAIVRHPVEKPTIKRVSPAPIIQPSESSSKKTLFQSIASLLHSIKTRYQSIRFKIRSNVPLFILRRRYFRKAIWGWVKRVVRSMLRMITIKRIDITVTSSTSDPAITGMIYGFVESSRYALQITDRSTISVRFIPVFDHQEQKATAEFIMQTSLGQMLWPAAVALITFPYVMTGILWFRAMQNKKKVRRENRQTFNSGTP